MEEYRVDAGLEVILVKGFSQEMKTTKLISEFTIFESLHLSITAHWQCFRGGGF